MDITRPDFRKRKLRRTMLWISGATVVVLVAVYFMLHLKPAIPEVDTAVWTDTVKQGPLLRQVRGPGTLVPREESIRLIPSQTEGTVARIHVLPGTHVEPNTVVMDLVNPELGQQLLDAQLQYRAARVQLVNTHARLESDMMTQRAGAATVGADFKQANLQAATDKSLFDLGVISGLSYNASRGRADELDLRNHLELQRLDLNQKTILTQLAVEQTKVEEAQAMLELKQRQQEALSVRAGIAGVLVDLPHQVGEHVALGTTLAKVVQPDQLKAALKIAETQAREIQIGQSAEIDTHNGIISGRITRIDPAVENGTVTVDAELTGSLPQGARPDLSIDGTIDLDRMKDVLSMGRPAFVNENSSVSLFRLDPDGKTATRVQVQTGRASVNAIQIQSGLKSGDSVILSDMSRWSSVDRVRLRNQ